MYQKGMQQLISAAAAANNDINYQLSKLGKIFPEAVPIYQNWKRKLLQKFDTQKSMEEKVLKMNA